MATLENGLSIFFQEFSRGVRFGEGQFPPASTQWQGSQQTAITDLRYAHSIGQALLWLYSPRGAALGLSIELLGIFAPAIAAR
jgi:hypothetical protein